VASLSEVVRLILRAPAPSHVTLLTET